MRSVRAIRLTTWPTPGVLVIADDRLSVTVWGGTRYGVLALALEDAGLSPCTTWVRCRTSVAGATATSTHGSGARNGSLSTAVSALEFVGADGSLRTVRRGDPEFLGSVIHLGADGVVTRVTLDVQPSYRIRQDVYLGVPWAALDDDGIRGLGYSKSHSTNCAADMAQMWVKSRIPAGQDDIDVPDELRSAKRRPARAAFVSEEDNTTPMDGTVGSRAMLLPHFRLDRIASNGDEIQPSTLSPLTKAPKPWPPCAHSPTRSSRTCS